MRRRWLFGFVSLILLVTAGCGASGSGGVLETAGQERGERDTPERNGPGRGDREQDESPLSYEETIDLSVLDVEDFWRQNLPRAFRQPYEPVADVVAYDSSIDDGGEVSECAEGATYEDLEGNAFYCPLDDVVAFDDENLFPTFFDDLGPFAIALVIAHEWGHAIQARTLALDAFTEVPSVLLEGQADCFAGAWSRYVDVGDSRNLVLGEGDLEVGLLGLLEVRDPVGLNPKAPGAHGSGFDRVTAFQEGFEGGVDRCAHWLEDPPLVTAVPFVDPTDLLRSGNLPYRQIVEETEKTLDVYWSEVLDDYERPEDVVAYDTDRDLTLERCDALGLEPERVQDYEGAVYYCADDRTIYYDDDLLRQVHREIGDVGAAVVLSNAWAAAMQDLLGVDGASLDLGFQADCFSGSWAGSIGVLLPDGTVEAARGGPVLFPFELILSPGDLDEVVQAFLAFGDSPDSEEVARGGGFERIGAFRTGFFAADPEGTCASLVPDEGTVSPTSRRTRR